MANIADWYKSDALKRMSEQAIKRACGEFGGGKWLNYIGGQSGNILYVKMAGVMYGVNADTGHIEFSEPN